MYIGIDLALRNTGIVLLNDDGTFKSCYLVHSDAAKINNEALLNHNQMKMWSYLADIKIGDEKEIAGLEGLSFNSTSASVDLIAANHWMTRCFLLECEIEYKVIPPKSWMKDVLPKEQIAEWAKVYPVVRAKKGCKVSPEQKKANAKSKAAIRKLAKEYMFNQVPKEVRDNFAKYLLDNKLPKDGVYDLSDAYHIAQYVLRKSK